MYIYWSQAELIFYPSCLSSHDGFQRHIPENSDSKQIWHWSFTNKGIYGKNMYTEYSTWQILGLYVKMLIHLFLFKIIVIYQLILIISLLQKVFWRNERVDQKTIQNDFRSSSINSTC